MPQALYVPHIVREVKGQKSHADEPIKNAQEFIETNFQEKITVDQLARLFALGRRNMERRLKKGHVKHRDRICAARKGTSCKKQLEEGQKNINEVMYEVGYSNAKAFRTTFKKITGLSPVEYKNKYNRDLVFAQN